MTKVPVRHPRACARVQRQLCSGRVCQATRSSRYDTSHRLVKLRKNDLAWRRLQLLSEQAADICFSRTDSEKRMRPSRSDSDPVPVHILHNYTGSPARRCSAHQADINDRSQDLYSPPRTSALTSLLCRLGVDVTQTHR